MSAVVMDGQSVHTPVNCLRWVGCRPTVCTPRPTRTGPSSRPYGSSASPSLEEAFELHESSSSSPSRLADPTPDSLFTVSQISLLHSARELQNLNIKVYFKGIDYRASSAEECAVKESDGGSAV